MLYVPVDKQLCELQGSAGIPSWGSQAAPAPWDGARSRRGSAQLCLWGQQKSILLPKALQAKPSIPHHHRNSACPITIQGQLLRLTPHCGSLHHKHSSDLPGWGRFSHFFSQGG